MNKGYLFNIRKKPLILQEAKVFLCVSTYANSNWRMPDGLVGFFRKGLVNSNAPKWCQKDLEINKKGGARW